MIKGALIGVVTFLISASGASAQSDDQTPTWAQQPVWNGPPVDLSAGWRVLGVTADNNIVNLVQHADSAKGSPYKRIWYRNENVLAPNGYHSTVGLNEVDCLEKRWRALQEAVYVGYNMIGRSESSDKPSPWEYIIPGSFGDAVLQILCTQ